MGDLVKVWWHCLVRQPFFWRKPVHRMITWSTTERVCYRFSNKRPAEEAASLIIRLIKTGKM